MMVVKVALGWISWLGWSSRYRIVCRGCRGRDHRFAVVNRAIQVRKVVSRFHLVIVGAHVLRSASILVLAMIVFIMIIVVVSFI